MLDSYLNHLLLGLRPSQQSRSNLQVSFHRFLDVLDRFVSGLTFGGHWHLKTFRYKPPLFGRLKDGRELPTLRFQQTIESRERFKGMGRSSFYLIG